MGYTEITGCGIRQHVLNRNKNTGKEEVFTQEDQTFSGRKTFLSGITTSDVEARTVEVSQSLTVDGYDISQIKNYLPNDVSAENKLTTESFVNSSVATNTAYFRGTFNSVEELEAYSGEKTNNDYAFVISEDDEGNTVYNRYKYNAENEEWVFEYSLNNSSFTSDQWEAINSGITEELVAQIGQGGVTLQQIFNCCHPVGEKYTQFPGDPEPAVLYNVGGVTSTWEDISSHFAGLSIRFAGGLAETFNKTLTVASKSSNNVTFTAAHGLTLGSLIVNAETHTQYTISAIVNTTTVTLNETPTDLQNNTTVLILQNDTMQGHKHTYYANKNKDGGSFSWGGGKYFPWENAPTTSPITDGTNGTPRTSSETRAKNTTVRLWKRVS